MQHAARSRLEGGLSKDYDYVMQEDSSDTSSHWPMLVAHLPFSTAQTHSLLHQSSKGEEAQGVFPGLYSYCSELRK